MMVFFSSAVWIKMFQHFTGLFSKQTRQRKKTANDVDRIATYPTAADFGPLLNHSQFDSDRTEWQRCRKITLQSLIGDDDNNGSK